MLWTTVAVEFCPVGRQQVVTWTITGRSQKQKEHGSAQWSSRHTKLSSDTHQSTIPLRNEGYSMQDITQKRKISYKGTPFADQCKLALTRIERDVWDPGAHMCMRIEPLKLFLVCQRNPQLHSSLIFNSKEVTPEFQCFCGIIRKYLWNSFSLVSGLLACFIFWWGCAREFRSLLWCIVLQINE